MSGTVQIADLTVTFETPGETVTALDGVKLDIQPGQRTAILGESGCGKTVLALATLSLLPQNACIDGSITIDGVDMLVADNARRHRGRLVSLCWSNAERFFNPVKTVGHQIVEAFTIHHPGQKKEGREKALIYLEKLGFDDPESVYSSYPFQLSGGMNQRAMIAMSMINDPKVLILDEPTRGLDDNNRDLVIKTTERLGNVTMIIITHDVDFARRSSDDVYIMRDGGIVDSGKTAIILEQPEHDYTKRLVYSCPRHWDSPNPSHVLRKLHGGD